jgi:hypothetical protein
MRYLLFLIPAAFLVFSCVKAPSQDPVPELEYQSMNVWQVNTGTGNRDTALLVLRYSDGDGDIFRNTTDDGPNIIGQTYSFNADSNKFLKHHIPITNAITQPADGYYKGKAIHGEIYIPMKEFRLNPTYKILKWEFFAVDMKGHKSNVVATPVFSLNF